MQQSETLSEPIDEIQDSFGQVREKLNEWLESAVALMPNAVVALVVVIFFSLLAKLVRSLTRRFLVRVTSSEAIARLLSTLASIATTAVGLFVALEVLHLDKTVTSLLAGAGVIGIALAFAFQDLAANLIAGVYLSFKRPFVIGDLIETNDVTGMVNAVDLRSTVLRTTDGQVVLLPNKEIFENKLINFSKSGTRRVDLQVGVSYSEDLESVREIALRTISDLDLRDTSRDVELFYEAFGGSSIDFVVRFWIDFQRQAEYRRALSEAIMALKKAFDAEGVVIPFPIRTLDFGGDGDGTLQTVLAHSSDAE